MDNVPVVTDRATRNENTAAIMAQGDCTVGIARKIGNATGG